MIYSYILCGVFNFISLLNNCLVWGREYDTYRIISLVNQPRALVGGERHSTLSTIVSWVVRNRKLSRLSYPRVLLTSRSIKQIKMGNRVHCGSAPSVIRYVTSRLFVFRLYIGIVYFDLRSKSVTCSVECVLKY